MSDKAANDPSIRTRRPGGLSQSIRRLLEAQGWFAAFDIIAAPGRAELKNNYEAGR